MAANVRRYTLVAAQPAAVAALLGEMDPAAAARTLNGMTPEAGPYYIIY